jgi:hypothetical protein
MEYFEPTYKEFTETSSVRKKQKKIPLPSSQQRQHTDFFKVKKQNSRGRVPNDTPLP